MSGFDVSEAVGELDNMVNAAWDAGYAKGVDWAKKCGGGIDAMTDTELAERGLMRLPVDADGVPIHVGDSIEIIGGEDGVAVAIELCEDGGWNVSMRPTGWDTPTLFAAESVRHHHEPTVEDVLREFAYGLGVPVADSYVAATAAKLRLAGENA